MIVPADPIADDATEEAVRRNTTWRITRRARANEERARGERSNNALLSVHVMVDISTLVEDHLGVRAQLTLGRQRDVNLGRVGQPREPERERRLFGQNRPAVPRAPHRSNGWGVRSKGSPPLLPARRLDKSYVRKKARHRNRVIGCGAGGERLTQKGARASGDGAVAPDALLRNCFLKAD